MKVVLASASVKNSDIPYNLQAMKKAMASCCGADLIVFGESVLQGFDCLSWEYQKDRNIGVQVTDTPIAQMQQAAREAHMAVSFGFIERQGESLYSSQIFIGAEGEIVNLFRRVSVGWREFDKTDGHYREGENFVRFTYGGKTFAIGLCGDLWTEGRPEEMEALEADIVLWPVWCDYAAEEWNSAIKHEYAQQASLCGQTVLLVNPYCADRAEDECAAGAAALFRDGAIVKETPAGHPGYLIAEV